jgi:hypothetical protein
MRGFLIAGNNPVSTNAERENQAACDLEKSRSGQPKIVDRSLWFPIMLKAWGLCSIFEQPSLPQSCARSAPVQTLNSL